MYFSHALMQSAIVIAPFALSVTGCHRNVVRDTTGSYRDIAHARFGKNVEFIPNVDSSFMLCVHREESPGQPIGSTCFMVYDMDRGTVILDDSLGSSQVFWIDSDRIRVATSPETVNGDVSPEGGYSFDVRQRKKD